MRVAYMQRSNAPGRHGGLNPGNGTIFSDAGGVNERVGVRFLENRGRLPAQPSFEQSSRHCLRWPSSFDELSCASSNFASEWLIGYEALYGLFEVGWRTHDRGRKVRGICFAREKLEFVSSDDGWNT